MSEETVRFGRQRAPLDLLAIVLLLTGFSALAVAFWLYTGRWIGVLLPLGFVIGAWATLRSEVTELELRGNTLLVRTLFRTYPIPRAHIRARHGTAIEVLNGNRYEIVPHGAASAEVAHAIDTWLLQEPDSNR